MKSKAPIFTDPVPSPPRATPFKAEATIVLLCGLWAAWLAAGSLGWLAAPLEKSVVWLALGTIALIAVGGREPVAGLVSPSRIRDERWLVAAALVVAVGMTASSLTVVNILAVAVLLSAVAAVRPAAFGRVAGPAALAVVALAVFRLVGEGTAVGWAIADTIGRAEGHAAALLARRPLLIGATFGGLDFLVVMIVLAIACRRMTPEWNARRLLYAVLGILVAQSGYLIILAFANDLSSLLPPVVHVAPRVDAPLDVLQKAASLLDVWTWGNALHAMLPWYLPVLAAALQSVVAVVMFHSAVSPAPVTIVRRQSSGLRFAPAALLIAAAVAAGFAPIKPDLAGRKIVVYDDGGLDWTTNASVTALPEVAPHYSLLPALVGSLGGNFVVSKDLNEGDLRDAGVLIVLPHFTLVAIPDNMQKKILDFVRAGGGLLVADSRGGQLVVSDDTVNALLQPTSLSLRGETVNSLTDRAEGNLMAAPGAMAAASSSGSSFSIGRSTALRLAWPAAPLLASRWSWSERPARELRDPLPPNAPGNYRGDLVLAAEQNFGLGRIVVLGDASCLSDDGIPFSYTFCGPLLASLAAKDAAPSVWWRQFVTLLAAIAAIALLVYRYEPLHLMAAAVALAIAVLVIHSINDTTAQLLPASGKAGTRPIVYVDGSHLEMMGRDPWRDDGIGGYMRMLTASGYLPLLSPGISPERLKGAMALVSIAPGRSFSESEMKAVDEFVGQGGNFISLCGAPDVEPSRAMLEKFKLGMEGMPVPPWKNIPEPGPLGSFAPNGSIAQFHAAWPVSSSAASSILWPQNGPPVIARAGQAFLIGDSQFALQKCLAPLPQATSADATDVPNAIFWQTTLRSWFGASSSR